MFVDLHTHSTASDGTDSPAEVVRRAVAADLSALALTDHDTLAGLDEGEAAAEGTGLTFIRGCEVAVGTEYGEAHILGLWLPRSAPRLEAWLEDMRASREERNRRIVHLLEAAGFAMDYEDVLEAAGGESIGRPHIARLMVKRQFVPNTNEAFTRYIGRGRPMYVPRDLPCPEEGMDVLLASGAVTVFAHPMLMQAPAHWLHAFVGRLADLGLHGLEVYHSDHGDKATRQALSLADHYGLALSGGSDYHGGARPGVSPGRGRGGLRIPLGVMEKLERLRAQGATNEQKCG